MKLIGWAIALAAAMATPAAAQAVNATGAAAATTTTNATAADTAVTGAAAQAAAQPFHYDAPVPGIGQPVPGGWLTQDQFTKTGEQAAAFHDYWLLTICVLITALVLGLLLFVMVRYRRGANPTPSRTSHNTMIEVIWTVIPVLILVAIAIPSIRLMRAQYAFPKADLTVKVVGNQWYWTYDYPDNGGIEVVSNILKEKTDPTLRPGERYRTDADGPPLLAVDERMVIPAGKVVKFIVTSNDVIHSFAMPSFWVKIDANPGMLNETWAKVDRPGVYFGQCSELCGARHGYMPIVIEAVTPERFAEWIASKGGTMPGATQAAAAAGATPAPTPAVATTGAPAEARPLPAISPAANSATNQ